MTAILSCFGGWGRAKNTRLAGSQPIGKSNAYLWNVEICTWEIRFDRDIAEQVSFSPCTLFITRVEDASATMHG